MKQTNKREYISRTFRRHPSEEADPALSALCAKNIESAYKWASRPL